MWSEARTGAGAGEGPEAKKVLAVGGTVRRGQRVVLTVVPLDAVEPNPEQPRKHFAEDKLMELAASILERGLLQPVVVRRAGDRYQLLAGERRLRAARLAGLDRLPAVVRDGDDALEIALIENLQREDLGPLDEAEALAALIERHGYSHREIADLLGKSRPYVSNTLSLNRLPQPVKADLQREGCSFSREVLMGVARQPDVASALALWSRLKLDAMSVRQFRDQHAGVFRGSEPIRETLIAARRFNRTLRRLGALAASPEELASLRRILHRTRRLVDGFMATIDPPARGVDAV
jgi:ParB family transcriptional regulator, chromosome partitioning protein